MSSISNCDFGIYNKIYSDVMLNNVVLDDFTYISNNTKIANTKIGKFSSVGPDVTIGLGKHPSRKFVSTHPIFFSKRSQAGISFADKSYFNEYEPISIGNDVWIGAGSTILDGVVIGDGAIIAAGSIVTNDVDPYTIVGGTPARLIRKRFTNDQIDFLTQFKWWNKDIKWLENNFQQFHDIDRLILLNTKLNP